MGNSFAGWTELVYCFVRFGDSVCSRKALGGPVVPELREGLPLRRDPRQWEEHIRRPVRHYAEGEI
jgi:hypothetical protein